MESPEVRTQLEQQTPGVTRPDQGDISAPFFTWAVRLLLCYFGLRLLYFALNVSSFAPPDEITHAGLCQAFSQALLLPENSPESYQFGLVTNTPWLYYWVMGKLLLLNFFGLPELTFLRLCNVPIALATVYFVWRTMLLLTRDRLSQLLLLALVTNTAMFTFLSASVSYDNLTNLWAAVSIYSLCAFLKERKASLLAGSLLAQLAGCLTKSTFLPLALILNLVLLANEWRDLRRFPAAFLEHLKGTGWRALLPLALMAVLLGLNLKLYGGNYLNYGTLAPTMAQVLSPEASMEYRIGARERIFSLYSEGKISYLEALQMTGAIQHPGDKADTFFMLMNYENLKADPSRWLGPLEYGWLWFQDMAGSILGIKGHLSLFKPPSYLIPVYLLMALALAGFIRHWRPASSGWLAPCLAATALCYAAFLLFKVNYNAYRYYGVTGITLQGRYLFPVLGPIYLLGCHYLLRLMPTPRLRLAVALVSALIFVAFDFPWFLAHATPQWFG